ncbi:3774_t:CDS:2, partial [Cetraspora pellucida]
VSNENNNLTIIYHNNQSNAITPISSESSLSTPTSPISSMNRSNDQTSVNNMITPPQTPGVKSPTKANFQFPPNTSDQNSQSMPPKVKRKRITQEQLADLVAMFEQTDTPSYDVREKLAKKLNMTNPQAASGHASSIGMINPGNFTFVPMFTNNGPSAGCQAKGRNNRRHSCVTSTINSQKKSSQTSPFTRQRAATVTGAPMTSHASHASHNSHNSHTSSNSQKMGIPPSIKIMPYGQDHQLHHVYGGHNHTGHTVPPSPVSPTTPILPPPIPSSHYMLSGLNPCTLPPPIVPPIKDLLAPPSDLYQSGQHSLTSVHHQSYTHPHHSYLSTVESQSTLSSAVSKTSPIDILATAAEFVQSEEKEKERLKALEAIKQEDENNDDSQKSSVWRPWLV